MAHTRAGGLHRVGTYDQATRRRKAPAEWEAGDAKRGGGGHGGGGGDRGAGTTGGRGRGGGGGGGSGRGGVGDGPRKADGTLDMRYAVNRAARNGGAGGGGDGGGGRGVGAGGASGVIDWQQWSQNNAQRCCTKLLIDW